MNKLLLKFIIFISIILLLIIILGSVLLSYVLSNKPPVHQQQINTQTMAEVTKKLQNEYVYISQPINYNNDPKTLILTNNEVNTLTSMLITGNQLVNADKNVLDDMFLQLHDGRFLFDGAKKLSFYTPFGSYINITAKFTLVIEDNKVTIDVLSLKTGDITIPQFFVDYFMKSEKAKLDKLPAIAKLLQVVKSVHASKNELTIVYYPKNMLQKVSSLMRGLYR